MKTFSSFLDVKNRDNKEHLNLLKQILEKAGFQVESKLDDRKEAYIYVKKPIGISNLMEDLSFGGIRLYTRGKDIFCFRSQNKPDTEPFGSAYELNVKEMFRELVQVENKELVGNRIIFYIIKELKDFFIQSAEAEHEDDTGGDAPMGIVGSSTGTDYASMIGNDMSSRR